MRATVSESDALFSLYEIMNLYDSEDGPEQFDFFAPQSEVEGFCNAFSAVFKDYVSAYMGDEAVDFLFSSDAKNVVVFGAATEVTPNAEDAVKPMGLSVNDFMTIANVAYLTFMYARNVLLRSGGRNIVQ